EIAAQRPHEHGRQHQPAGERPALDARHGAEQRAHQAGPAGGAAARASSRTASRPTSAGRAYESSHEGRTTPGPEPSFHVRERRSITSASRARSPGGTTSPPPRRTSSAASSAGSSSASTGRPASRYS